MKQWKHRDQTILGIRKLTVHVTFDSFFLVDRLFYIKSLKIWKQQHDYHIFGSTPFSPFILSMLRKFEHLLSIYYQSWETMFLAERNIKLDIRLDIKFDIKLDIKFVLDRGVSGGLERVLLSASAAYVLSWWFTWNIDLKGEGTWVFLATDGRRTPNEQLLRYLSWSNGQMAKWSNGQMVRQMQITQLFKAEFVMVKSPY